MSAFERKLNCQDIAPLLVFYACDEVSDKERKQIETHLSVCVACSAQIAEEREFQEILVAGQQPADQLDSAGVLLAQCRSELAEQLDDLSAPPVREHWHPFGGLRRWMALRPAWSGALLVFLGVLVGTQILPWLQIGSTSNSNGQAMNVLAAPNLSDDQLSKMAVANINFSPSSGSTPGIVQLQLSAEQPMVLSGSADDSNMRRVLTYVLENGERFDAGVRLDCLDALRAGVRDQQVRRALITAARQDQNAAVRMKALESLRDEASEDAVRQMLLEVLKHDDNPGVRVEAVNLLVRSLDQESSDLPALAPDAPNMPALPPSTAGPRSPVDDESIDRVVHVLEQLKHKDPNRYVRLRSAAALRQIGPREVQ
jgi:hypothetical protein